MFEQCDLHHAIKIPILYVTVLGSSEAISMQ